MGLWPRYPSLILNQKCESTESQLLCVNIYCLYILRYDMLCILSYFVWGGWERPEAVTARCMFIAGAWVSQLYRGMGRRQLSTWQWSKTVCCSTLRRLFDLIVITVCCVFNCIIIIIVRGVSLMLLFLWCNARTAILCMCPFWHQSRDNSVQSVTRSVSFDATLSKCLHVPS